MDVTRVKTHRNPHKMRAHTDRRVFSHTADRTHKINTLSPRVQRGGTRL